MNKLYEFIKLIVERQEIIEKRNIEIYAWIERAMERLNFQQEGTGEWQSWHKDLGENKKIVVLVDIINSVPMKVEVYGQKLHKGYWHTFPKSKKATTISLEEDASIRKIINDFKNKLSNVLEWSKRI